MSDEGVTPGAGGSDEAQPTADESLTSDADRSTVSRRSTLAGLGIAGLLGLGAVGSASGSSDPRGTVGTEANPLQNLYTQSIDAVPDGSQAFQLSVGGKQGLYVHTGGYGNSTRAVLGGGSNTVVSPGDVIVGGEDNETYAGGAVVGGTGNVAGVPGAGHTAVLGGTDNGAHADDAVVLGGLENLVEGKRAIAGGLNSNVTEDRSVGLGYRARVTNTGSFLWADSSTFGPGGDERDFDSVADDEFAARATGGVRFVTGIDVNDDPSSGVTVGSGEGSWSSLSARAAKSNVDAVEPTEVLAGVESLDVATWNYDGNGDVPHMGPMAEDFHDAFGLGGDEHRISTVDADGVALAAIQGLAERNAETSERVDVTNDRVDELEAENEQLRSEIRELRAEVEFIQNAVVATDGGESGGEGR